MVPEIDADDLDEHPQLAWLSEHRLRVGVVVVPSNPVVECVQGLVGSAAVHLPAITGDDR